MEHWAPHQSVLFEGYYSKFSLPSGASLAVIVSAVPKGSTRPYLLSFTYVPSPRSSTKTFQRELWVSSIERIETGPGHAFELRIPAIGSVKCAADSTTTYDLACEDVTLHAKTNSRTPWSPTKDTPAGLLVYLPLPLHWHVQSLSSACSFNLQIPALQLDLPSEDREGKALVHQEKNWAKSFPSAHIWIQAREGSRGICLAGGVIDIPFLSVQAFLLGYRSPTHTVDFTPPFALSVFVVSPFMNTNVDWEARTVSVTISGFWRKIVVRAKAPRGTFFALSAPYPEGHRDNELAESFEAVVEVEVWERSWWFGAWREVRKDRFEGGALEFGGRVYGMQGTEQRWN